MPPAKNGDYAFLLHVARSLKSRGKGAIILPHGVLFRGNVEAEIRRNLIRRGYIKGIIGLPPNLFYGTGIPACSIVVDKENADARRGIFMIDASRGFVKDGNKNRLRHQDIHKIVDVFNNQIEIPKYSRMVPLAEIADEKNNYNLNIPRYIDSQEPEDIQDIEAHLLGGIPVRDSKALESYWQVCPSLESELFEASERTGYSRLKVEQGDIKKIIYEHPEFVAYASEVDDHFRRWRERSAPVLKRVEVGAKPKVLIRDLSEDMLQTFDDIHLIDKYDVYQHLMSYWSDVMQDDVYMIAVDGWQANTDLLPPRLVIERYFPEEQKTIEQLEADRDSITRQREEMEEEHSGEEGMLEAVKNGKGKITKGAVQERVVELKSEILESSDTSFEQKRLAKAIRKDFAKINWEKGLKDEAELFSELDVLYDYLLLVESEAAATKKVREARAALDRKVAAKYGELDADEVKTLVVDDKWMNALNRAVKLKMERISRNLTGRIKTLSERYAAPLPETAERVRDFTAKVAAHLAKMGFAF